MAKKIKKVRIFDPVSGKYKIVNETPEIKRQIQERQKKQAEERKAKQKTNKILANKKKLEQLKSLNPGQYEGYFVDPETGNIIRDRKRYYEQQREKIRKAMAEAIKRDDEKRKQYYEQKRVKLNKSFSIAEIQKAKGRGYQAVQDLNYLAKELNKVIDQMPDDLKESVISILGGKKISEDYEIGDFYNENYREIMLPNMIKEVQTIIGKIKLVMNAVLDYAKKNKNNSEIFALCNKLIYHLNDLLQTAENSKTAQEYRANFSTTEPEPKYTNDLAKSGL